MTTQLGLPFSVCCPICLEFPFSSPIPLLSSHLYACMYAYVYSHHRIPRTFSIYLTVVFTLPSLRSSETTKSLGPFPLLHLISIFFYTIHNVFCSLFACQIAITNLSAALQLHSTYVHILLVSINVCLRLTRMCTTPNTVISTIFP